MSAFSPVEWFVLGAIALAGVLASLRSLGVEAAKEQKLHLLKIRAAQLRIEHILAMKALNEPTGVDIIDDEDLPVEIIDDEEILDEADSPSPESIPAAA